MRPPIDETPIRTLLEVFPEFEGNYLDLMNIYGEDLTPETVLMELSTVVANLLVGVGDEDHLGRCLEAVECIAASPGGGELVGYCFLAQLPDGSRPAVEDRLGPLTRQVAEALRDGQPLEDPEEPTAP